LLLSVLPNQPGRCDLQRASDDLLLSLEEKIDISSAAG